MAKLNDFIKQYDFKCKKCGAELTSDSATETALVYGLIILAGEKDGFIGWSCPACNAQVTNLTQVSEDHFWFIHHVYNHASSLGIDGTLMYRSFPYSFCASKDDFVDRNGIFLESDYKVLSKFDFGRLIEPSPGRYSSFNYGTQAMGPAISFFVHDLSQIGKLLNLENKNQIKAFPRYEIPDWLTSKIDNLCWNNRVKFYFLRDVFERDVKNIGIEPDKKIIQQSYEFLTILDNVNSFELGFVDGICPSYSIHIWDGCVLASKKVDFYQNNDFNTKVWQAYHSDWMHELLNNLAEDFISDYLGHTAKTNHNKESTLKLVGSYIKKLYDAITSEYKRNTIRKETRTNSQKRIEEAEKCFSKIKIISNDNNINEIKIKISQIASLKLADSFLILGERGTGKDLFARAIHEASKQIGQLVKIDCGAIPERLFESELFGYKKGAFTGALQDTIGKFGYAMGGTLFFDEIGNLPLNLQPKLLRALQDRQYVPVGSGEVKKIDAKFIFATNKDLNKMVEENSFMPDLYDRFKRPQITIPPLREIKSDVILLANYFIDSNDTHRQDNKELQPIRLSKVCVEILKAFDWPGNIRELQQVIKEIVLMRQASGDRSEISESELPDDILKKRKNAFDSNSKLKKKLLGNTKINDEELIHWMKELGNNKTRVAEQLGVTYKTIWERCKRIEL
jgi:transcriptional regulator with PAS, ATPase and Fis domain